MVDFLLGVTSQSYTAVQPADAKLRSTYWSAYVGDSWRLSPKLTIDSGLRYEYCRHSATSTISRSTSRVSTPPIPSWCVPRTKGRAWIRTRESRSLHAGHTRARRQSGPRARNPDRDNWAPRLGVAYSPSENTVFRAGFGVFNQ